MREERAKTWIGTSGWYYPHWVGKFYPEEITKKDWFSFYCGQFPTVEVNSSFYRVPSEKMVQGWREKSPREFLFSVKVWRGITHYKKLREITGDLKNFLERVKRLGTRLGPLLFQLPPSLKRDPALLQSFLEKLPRRGFHTVEFRNPSWYTDEILEILEGENAALCVHDMGPVPPPKAATGSFIYLRLHGPGGRYRGSYTDEHLEDWAAWLRSMKQKGKGAFVYFNNDVEGHAVANARRLGEILERGK